MDVSATPEAMFSKGLKEEYRYGAGYLIRWNFYDFEDNGRNFHEESVDTLDLRGEESILDIGCGRGAVLGDIAKRKEHGGLLVGLDNSDGLQFALNRDSCQYVCASADTSESEGKTNLPFVDDSFDISLAYFMLYHTTSPESTIDELVRVTKKDGTISIATSGANNKPLHSYYKDMISKHLGLYIVPSYVKTFNTAYAGNILRSKFNTVIEHNYDGLITFNANDLEENPKDMSTKIGAFVNSLRTINTHFEPQYASMIDDTILELVVPEMQNQVSEQGAIQEITHRTTYTCRDPK